MNRITKAFKNIASKNILLLKLKNFNLKYI